VVARVINAACEYYDISALRDEYRVNQLMTASFSNGIIAHQTFVQGGTAASALYQAIIFDARHLSAWQPKGAAHYLNTKAPQGRNPQASDWFLGGRFRPYVAAATPENGFNDHNRCPMLAYHAFSTYAPQ
jgi:hypothetical protein